MAIQQVTGNIGMYYAAYRLIPNGIERNALLLAPLTYMRRAGRASTAQQSLSR